MNILLLPFQLLGGFLSLLITFIMMIVGFALSLSFGILIFVFILTGIGLLFTPLLPLGLIVIGLGLLLGI
ncbi:MAG: hypothetical protein ACQEQG_09160 [Bacillota bacterium]